MFVKLTSKNNSVVYVQLSRVAFIIDKHTHSLIQVAPGTFSEVKELPQDIIGDNTDFVRLTNLDDEPVWANLSMVAFIVGGSHTTLQVSPGTFSKVVESYSEIISMYEEFQQKLAYENSHKVVETSRTTVPR